MVVPIVRARIKGILYKVARGIIFKVFFFFAASKSDARIFREFWMDSRFGLTDTISISPPDQLVTKSQI